MSEQYPYSFGKYRVEEEIGRGGFGTVFRAVDVDLERPVAIKIMDPIYLRDQRWVARFRREARVMAMLDHAHIVPIYEISEEEGRLFLAMKLIDGPDLTEIIDQRGALPWEVVLDLTGQIASALDYAHQHNVIHRDLKPGNILINNGQAMLTDFGLASMVEDNSMSISMTGGIAGTYNYMPPEVFNNEDVTIATDVYALGCVLYEMLTGRMLVEGKSTAAIIGAHLKGITIDEPLPEGTPPGTRELLQIALAKDPLDRTASAGQLAQELQRLSSDRLTVPYGHLEEAMTGKQWLEALTLAAEIRSQDPSYRDVATLEERAQREHWSEQWHTEAKQALAEDDFDVVRGALSQWHRVAADDPEIKRFEQELALAEQYVKLQQIVAGGQWQTAQAAAGVIYALDPSFRDIAALQLTIRENLTSPQPQDVVSEKPEKEETPAGKPPKAPITRKLPPESKTAGRRGVPGWVWLVCGAMGLIILVFGIRAVFFTGGAAPAEEASEAGYAEAFWSLSVWSDEIAAPVLRELAPDFLAATGGDLVVEQVADMHKQFAVAAPAGEGPDIMIGSHDWIGGLVESGLLATIDLGDKAEQFRPEVLDGFTYTYNGRNLYGMPYSTDILAFCRNTHLVPEPPATWDEVAEIGAALVADGSTKYGFVLSGTTYDAFPINTAFGGYIFGTEEDGQYDPKNLGLDSEGFIESGEWIDQMIRDGLMPQSTDWDTAHVLFETGDSPFLMTGPSVFDRFWNSGLSFECGPFPDGGEPFMVVKGFMINALSENKLMAETFLTDFVATEETMQALIDAEQRIPAFIPTFEAIEPGNFKDFAEVSEIAQPIPAIPEMAAVWEPWRKSIMLIIYQELTPKEALTDAAQQVRDNITGS